MVLYQLWAFIVPGLTRRERRMAIPFVLCFVVAVHPRGASSRTGRFRRHSASSWASPDQQFAPLLTADKFLSFVMLVALSFGLAFEFPIVLSFLLAVGAVSTRQLRDWRRGAILGIALFAAIITPSSDPYTMLAMTIPMVLFYEAAIIVGRLLKR